MESEGAFLPPMFIDNFIAQRIFYFPSAVGKTGKLHERLCGSARIKRISAVPRTQTVRRIRNEGDDRQGH